MSILSESMNLIVHNYGPGRVFVTLHAEVPYAMNLLAAHDIIDIAEHRVAGQRTAAYPFTWIRLSMMIKKWKN